MVDIQQQINAAGGLDHFGTVERSLLQVEGTHKLVLVFRQFLLAHFGNVHLYRNTVLGRLDDAVALGREVDSQLGMSFNHTLDGIGQFVGVGSFRVGEQVGDVVDGGSRIL